MGVGSGCSSCGRCALAAFDYPEVTLSADLPEETSSSVHTFLGAGSPQAVGLSSAQTMKLQTK